MIPREVMDWQMSGAYPLIVEIPGIGGHLEGPHEPHRFHPRRGGNPCIASRAHLDGDGEDSDVMEDREDQATRWKRRSSRMPARKASRILAEARTRSARRIRAEWRAHDRRRKSRRLDADRDARLAAVRQELAASLPLDFMRARLAFIQEAVAEALDGAVRRSLGRPTSTASSAACSRASRPFAWRTASSSHAAGIERRSRRGGSWRQSIPGAVVEAVKELAGEDGRADAGTSASSWRPTDGSSRFRGNPAGAERPPPRGASRGARAGPCWEKTCSR